MQYIALLDCNNFFVSCERLFRPDLKQRPVVVLSSNDGCVIARSKEIKDIGIPMGVPYFQIKDTLREINAVTFSTHFALYRDISKRVFEVVREHFDTVEQYSIDECFIRFESKDPEGEIIKLKQVVEQRVGIPVSIGVSSSKTRAKYVNSVAKKTNGIAVWGEARFQEEVSLISLYEIWGVGKGRTDQFKKHGIKTVADLTALSPAIVAKLFGVEGSRLFMELNGTEAYLVTQAKPSQKTIMNTRSFANTTNELPVLRDALLYHLHQGVKDLQTMDLQAKVLRILLGTSRHGDYMLQGSSLSCSFSPTQDLFTLEKVAIKLLSECFKPDVPYKKAGVILADLVAVGAQTESLFGVSEKEAGTKVLTKTLHEINRKLGSDSLQLGRVSSDLSSWSVRKDLLSPAYTTNWSQLKTVLAREV